MLSLFLHNRPVESVFELIGSNENSLTFALGWCLREAPALLGAIADRLRVEEPNEQQATVLLQEHQSALGFTDVEVRDTGRLAWIIEAKIGFDPPHLTQLRKYAERLNSRHGASDQRLLIVLAQSDRNNLVLQRYVPLTVDGISVRVLSWGQLIDCCEHAAEKSSARGREALLQMILFIRKVLLMRDSESNQVYVVSISEDFCRPAGTTFQKVVTEHSRYFHPITKNWPNTPPNYFGFRWGGQLQSIHHVDTYKVIDCMLGEFPDANDEKLNSDYFLYTLGPAMRPPKPLRNGPKIVMANRVTCALDLLLTSETISEALDKTKARQRAVEI